jgi:hypothetical protein
VSTCGSCQAEITWAVTTKGKRMPVDAEPAEDGNVVLHPGLGSGDLPTATVIPKAEDDPPPVFPRYRSHFATCPHADTHRRTR